MIALVAASASASACSGPPASTTWPGLEKTHIVVAAVPSEAAAGLYIAQQKGIFAREGLRVTILDSTSSAAVIPDLVRGTVDVASGQYTSYILASASGQARMRILAAGMALGPRVQEILTAPRSRIRNLGGLAGKRVAVNVLNGVTADMLYSALAAYQVTPRQVILKAMPFPKMARALETGQVDAIYVTEPYVSKFVFEYGFQVLADLDTGATQNFPVAGYGATAAWVARYPHTAAAFTAAITRGNALGMTDLAALQSAMASNLDLRPYVAVAMAPATFPAWVDPVQLQRVADLMLTYQQLQYPFDVTTLLGT